MNLKKKMFKSSWNLLQYGFRSMHWFCGWEACGILAPQTGMKTTPPTLEGEVPTTVLPGKFLKSLKTSSITILHSYWIFSSLLFLLSYKLPLFFNCVKNVFLMYKIDSCALMLDPGNFFSLIHFNSLHLDCLVFSLVTVILFANKWQFSL